MTAVVGRLQEVLPEEVLVTDADVLDSLGRDQAAWVQPGRAAVAVRARGTADVQAVLRVASATGTPVVPRGAGSGLAGGASAVDGCVVLVLDRMRELRAEPDALRAVAQPGVLNAEVRAAAGLHGLRYAPDPASAAFSSIGGNVATNAGGLCCVRDGCTREAVLGLEVVLADGTVLRTGSGTIKDVAGLDLTSLFVGSEGTLGIVTEATLRLLPAASGPTATLVAGFPTLAAAGRAVVSIIRSSRPALLELLDRVTLEAVQRFKPVELDADAAVLLARTDAGPAGAAEAAVLLAACEAAGASYAFATDDPAEGDALLEVRRLAWPALEASGHAVLDDVGVPVHRLPDLLERVQAVATEHGVLVGTFGHAGDGNLHPTIVVPRNDPAAAIAGRRAFDGIVAAALALGGTCTGEHGVGVAKREWAARQLHPGAVRVQAAVKAALDPAGILNPGKLLPADVAAQGRADGPSASR